MDRGHMILLVADELLDVVLEVLLLGHDFNVLQVECDGSSQETVNELSIELVIVEVVVVILPPCPSIVELMHCTPRSASQFMCLPISRL